MLGFSYRLLFLCMIALCCALPNIFINPGSLIFEDNDVNIYTHKAVLDIKYEGLCPTTKEIVEIQRKLIYVKRNLNTANIKFNTSFDSLFNVTKEKEKYKFVELRKLAEFRITTINAHIQNTITLLETLKGFAPTEVASPNSRKRRAIHVIVAVIVGALLAVSVGMSSTALVKATDNLSYIKDLELDMTQIQNVIDQQNEKINEMVYDINVMSVAVQFSHIFLSLNYQLTELESKLIELDNYIDKSYDEALEYYNALVRAGKGIISPILLPLHVLERTINRFQTLENWIAIYTGRQISKYYPLIRMLNNGKNSVIIPFTSNTTNKVYTIFPFPYQTDNGTIINEFSGKVIVSPDLKYASLNTDIACVKSFEQKLYCDLSSLFFQSWGCPLEVLNFTHNGYSCKGYWKTMTLTNTYIISYNDVHVLRFPEKAYIHLTCPWTATKLVEAEQLILPHHCSFSSKHGAVLETKVIRENKKIYKGTEVPLTEIHEVPLDLQLSSLEELPQPVWIHSRHIDLLTLILAITSFLTCILIIIVGFSYKLKQTKRQEEAVVEQTNTADNQEESSPVEQQIVRIVH